MRKVAAVLVLVALSTLGVHVAAQKADTPAYAPPDDATFSSVEVKIKRPGDGSQSLAKEGESIEDQIKREGDFEIAATLNIPNAETHGASPYPTVLFISGSGSQDRNGFQGPLDLGSWQVLDAIANAGFVVLRADDRGLGGTPVGPKGIVPTEIGYNALLNDAACCLTYLRTRREVDTKRIYLVGHSEGGLSAALLASESAWGIAGVVSLAGAGRNFYDITLDQTEAAMKDQPILQRLNNMKAQREFQDAVKEDREPDFNILGEESAEALKAVWKTQITPVRRWWHEHFNLDVPGRHGQITCPVFVLNGASDFQVSPDRDARQIIKDLMAGKCTDATLRIYPDLDHLFKPCGGQKSELKMYYKKRDVDKDVVKDVVEWLKRHAQ